MSAQSISLRELFSRELSRVDEEQTAKILVFTHRQADPDALCAASGLCQLLVDAFPKRTLDIQIIVPQAASLLGQSVCSQLGIKFVTEMENDRINDCNLIVIVDTGDPHLLEPYSAQIMNSTARKILVDHHSTSKSSDNWRGLDGSCVERGATSTCEIVARGFAETRFSKELALTLLTGLMFDSQHLGIATASTLEAALILVKAGAEIDAAKGALHNKPDRSELLARVKSAQRLQYEQIGKFLILKTEVSSFHASVARMLLMIGADVGVAYGESDGEARVSVRSSQSFFKETGIDLAEEAKKISDFLGIAGGGHPTAASLSGKAVPVELANKLIQDLKLTLPKTW
ncbi:MAG: DHH family phosphoesterase [Nitrososphaerales archaeon]